MKCFKKYGIRIIPKKQYETLEEAEKAAKEINAKTNLDHKVEAYDCVICGKYHLGQKTKLKVKR
jgi:hypothetical protein